MNMRWKLINAFKENKSIKDTAIRLKINYSTAKYIVRQYRETGVCKNVLL